MIRHIKEKGEDEMDIFEKIKTFFKGVGIFCLMYIVISGNGDDTFFGGILMLVSLVMTFLFLDENTNKITLVATTVLLSAMCFRGFVEEIPFLLLILGAGFLYYFFGCDRDFGNLKNKLVSLFYDRDKSFEKRREIRTVRKKEWKAWNIFHPLERYAYSDIKKCLIVKKAFPPLFGTVELYPLSEIVHLDMCDIKYTLFWCKWSIPVRYNANSHTPTKVTFSNIRRKKLNELVEKLEHV